MVELSVYGCRRGEEKEPGELSRVLERQQTSFTDRIEFLHKTRFPSR